MSTFSWNYNFVTPATQHSARMRVEIPRGLQIATRETFISWLSRTHHSARMRRKCREAFSFWHAMLSFIDMILRGCTGKCHETSKLFLHFVILFDPPFCTDAGGNATRSSFCGLPSALKWTSVDADMDLRRHRCGPSAPRLTSVSAEVDCEPVWWRFKGVFAFLILN